MESASPNETVESSGIESPAEKKKKRKKKRARYSNEFREIQKLDKRLSKAEREMARAVTSGLDTWRSRSERSGKKSRDGGMRDALDNGARAYARYVEKAAGVPGDLISLFYPYGK